jgi:hypothetical protein
LLIVHKARRFFPNHRVKRRCAYALIHS